MEVLLCECVNLLKFLAVSEQVRDSLVSNTKEDKNLQKLIKRMKQGFPMCYKALEPQLRHLYKFSDTRPVSEYPFQRISLDTITGWKKIPSLCGLFL